MSRRAFFTVAAGSAGRASRVRGFGLVEWLVVMLITASLLAVGGRLVWRSRVAARSFMCLSNLRQLGMAMAMYQADHGRLAFPLAALEGPGLIDGRCFHCPDDRGAGSGAAGSYEPFHIARPLSDENSPLIACPRHGGEVPVLFGSGTVKAPPAGAVSRAGRPVRPGALVRGGVLGFGDGLTVNIEDTLPVGVLPAIDGEAESRYAAVYIPEEASGSLEIVQPETAGRRFEVVTAAAIVSSRGGLYRVTTAVRRRRLAGTDFLVCATVVEVSEGSVRVFDRSRDTAGVRLDAAAGRWELVLVLPAAGPGAGVPAGPPRPGWERRRFPPGWFTVHGLSPD